MYYVKYATLESNRGPEQLRYRSRGPDLIPLSAYFPFIGVFAADPITSLGKLKADISVITERLEGSIKLAGEPYYSELYALLIDKLDLKNWNKANHPHQ